jgi:hypothetical protein
MPGPGWYRDCAPMDSHYVMVTPSQASLVVVLVVVVALTEPGRLLAMMIQVEGLTAPQLANTVVIPMAMRVCLVSTNQRL